MQKHLTQDRLKELLHYDPDTGVFTWIQKPAPRGRAIIGSVAGGLKQHGYITIGINQREYYAHRLAWLYVYGEWPEDQIDHINHNGSDNRINNLRKASDKINSKNKRLLSTNKSGVHGVYWSRKERKWCAQMKINGKTTRLGADKDLFEVICIRLSAQTAAGYHRNHGVDVNG